MAVVGRAEGTAALRGDSVLPPGLASGGSSEFPAGNELRLQAESGCRRGLPRG